MIEFENLGVFIEGIEAYVAESKVLASATYRGLVSEVFTYIVDGTPQYTGNLAAEWKLTLGGPALGYAETSFKGAKIGGPNSVLPEPFNRTFNRNFEAMEYAKAAARPGVKYVSLGTPVFISNATPYATTVQAGGGKHRIRPVNLPIEMVTAAHEKYSSLGALSEARALEFAGAKI